MGHSLAETPLAIFTLLSPMAAVAFICIGILWLMPLRCLIVSTEERIFIRRRMVRNMLYIWIALVVGFLSASFHMHYPFHAPFALMGIGRSPLTNEIVSGILFMACGGLWWLYKVFEFHPWLAKLHISDTFQKIWLMIAMLCALAFCFFIGVAYYIPTVPAWHTISALGMMMLLGFLTGPALASYIVIISGINYKRIHAVLLCVNLVAFACYILAISYFTRFNLSFGNAHTHIALEGMPYYKTLFIIVNVLVITGFLLWYRYIIRLNISGTRMFLVVVLLALAVLLTRFMFYGMYVTPGLA